MKAKKPAHTNRLEEAMAMLIQNQATFLQNQTALLAQISEPERQTAERSARIEERLQRIEAILLEHSRVLEALPDAIRQKIGFKPPEQ